MGSDLQHILLTRFNLPSPGAESFVRAQQGWLRNRVSLFERFCLPSVLAQSERRFTWIVYVDPESPPWFMDWLDTVTARRAFYAVRREAVSRQDLLDDIAMLVGETPSTLVTTNLDNDDGLAVDFVARVREASTGPGRAAIYLTRGLVRSTAGLYLRTDRHNAFCSVREPWDGAITCWSDWHNRLPLHMRSIELGGAPAWLQVVHGTNVSNRIRGRRVRPAIYRSSFPGLLDDVPAPSSVDLVGDRLVHGPARAVRESARAGAKRTGMVVLGRDGLDRAKNTLAAVRVRLTT